MTIIHLFSILPATYFDLGIPRADFQSAIRHLPFQIAYYGPPNKPVIALRCSTSHETIKIVFADESDPDKLRKSWESFYATNAYQKFGDNSISQIPLGNEVKSIRQALSCRVGNIFVKASYHFPTRRDGSGNRIANNPNAERSQNMLELLLRQSVSRLLGAHAQLSSTVIHSGFAFPSLQRPGKPRVINMASLAARANFSPEYDEELGLYRFQWRGKSVVVPLASDQIKVNGVWKKLGEFVLQKNKETYIDPVGLDAAVGN